MPITVYSTRSIWRLWPERETVTLRSRGKLDAEAVYRSFTVHNAKRRPADAGESAQSGGLTSGLASLRFELARDMLDASSAPDPKVGDILVDASGQSYRVEKVGTRMFGNVFHCEVNEQS